MSIGFTIIKHKTRPIQSSGSGKALSFKASAYQYDFYHQTNSKFQLDKLFVETQQYIYGIDGPILNLRELLVQHGESSWETLFIDLYEEYKENLPAHLKGDFAGFVFEKETEQFLVFNNDVGTRRIFYTNTEDGFIVAPALLQLSNYCNANGTTGRLNRFAAYSMLTYGAMQENQTLIENVYRLLAGESLVFKSNQLEVNRYVDYNDIDTTEKPTSLLLEEVNDHFVRALRQEMDKDQEYSYQSIGTLSGGLDSRMTVMLAHKLGYRMKTFCFSQSNYHDERIARDIAKHIGEELIFLPLDEAKHLFELEENLESYDALSFYTNAAHFAWGLKQLDLKRTGLIHTGMIGDGIFGGGLTAPKVQRPNLRSKVISNKLFPKIETEMKKIADGYANEESFYLYNRLLNLTISGTYICAPYGYHSTPFMDAELIKLLFSIPPKEKYFHKLYMEWINRFHPEVTAFPWERTRMKPTAHWKTLLSRYTLKMEHLYRKYTNTEHLLTMAPYALWVKQYPEIEQFFNAEYERRKELVQGDKELATDVSTLFEKGNTVEKSMVLTLLGGIERYKLEV